MLTDIFNLGLLDNIWFFAIVAIVAIILNIAVYKIQTYSNFTLGILLCMAMDTVLVAYILMKWVL